MKKRMGPQAAGLAHPFDAGCPAPDPLTAIGALTEVMLIDAETATAIGGMGISWWHEEVRAGRAPKPAIRRPRCTRWRLADVCAFWRHFAEVGSAETSIAAAVSANAAKASAAAKAARNGRAA